MDKKDSINDYKQYLISEEKSENTIYAYMKCLRQFFEKYDEINKPNMLDFKKYLMDTNSIKTVQLKVIALNQYCNYIGHPEYKVKSPKSQKRLYIENVITEEEYQRLLDDLMEDGDTKGYWMIKYLANTGARVSEFVKLTKDSLNRGYCDVQNKGKLRRIYYPKALVDESREYFNKVNDRYLFPSRYGGAMTTRGVAGRILKYGEKYGIRKEVMHPHSFRHYFAKNFLAKGGELTMLSNLLGHESVSTTAIYTQGSEAEQKEALNAIYMQ